MIISASRRTDIPAYYGRWFMDKIATGSVETKNPFNGIVEKISLKPEDVDGIIFWSRNPAPMISDFSSLHDSGYRFYFQITIVGYPRYIDPGSPNVEEAVKTAKTLRDLFGPRSVVWRYDPVALTSDTNASWHKENFAYILRLMEKVTDTCVISFIDRYRKMEKNYFSLLKSRDIEFYNPELEELSGLAEEFSEMAAEKGIATTACCESDILGAVGIKKAMCIDTGRLSDIAKADLGKTPKRATRSGCGCYLSKDIGAYDTCVSGCAYCYATRSRELAIENRNRARVENLSVI